MKPPDAEALLPSAPPHLSMNFWKIFPLKLSQISTMYGCRGTNTNSRNKDGKSL